MANNIEINETEIRNALISRAEAFAKANKTSFSAMGLMAVNDSKFLGRVQNPEVGFNIKTYQKMVEWLDAHEKASKSDAP